MSLQSQYQITLLIPYFICTVSDLITLLWLCGSVWLCCVFLILFSSSDRNILIWQGPSGTDGVPGLPGRPGRTGPPGSAGQRVTKFRKNKTICWSEVSVILYIYYIRIFCSEKSILFFFLQGAPGIPGDMVRSKGQIHFKRQPSCGSLRQLISQLFLWMWLT